MDENLKDEWTKAINDILEMDPHKRRHFALLLVNLAKCYTNSDDWKAVILIHNNENSLLTFSAGADEVEAAEMLKSASDAILLAATAGAPPKEMFN